jgi:membrane protein YqaA with SNARE-associated domain
VLAAFGAMAWLMSDPARTATVAGLVRSPIGLLVLFGLSALSSATLILPAPGLALTAVAGAAGAPVLIGMVAGLGQAVGELTGYAAGWSGRSLLPDNAGTAKLRGWLERRGTIVIFVLALVPNPVFDVAGIAAGALRMPVLRYLAAAAAGKVIKNVLVASGVSILGGLLVSSHGG